MSTLAWTAALLFGVFGNIIAVRLMNGRLTDALTTSWLPAGMMAGLAGGIFTVWSRTRRDGREHPLDVLLTYYLGMAVFWCSFVLIQRIVMCVQYGGWTAFDLRDHLQLILVFLVYGTLSAAVVVFLPLTWLARYAIWRLHTRDEQG